MWGDRVVASHAIVQNENAASALFLSCKISLDTSDEYRCRVMAFPATPPPARENKGVFDEVMTVFVILSNECMKFFSSQLTGALALVGALKCLKLPGIKDVRVFCNRSILSPHVLYVFKATQSALKSAKAGANMVTGSDVVLDQVHQ